MKRVLLVLLAVVVLACLGYGGYFWSEASSDPVKAARAYFTTTPNSAAGVGTVSDVGLAPFTPFIEQTVAGVRYAEFDVDVKGSNGSTTIHVQTIEAPTGWVVLSLVIGGPVSEAATK